MVNDSIICLYLIVPVHVLNLIASAETCIQTQQRLMLGSWLEHNCELGPNWNIVYEGICNQINLCYSEFNIVLGYI